MLTVCSSSFIDCSSSSLVSSSSAVEQVFLVDGGAAPRSSAQLLRRLLIFPAAGAQAVLGNAQLLAQAGDLLPVDVLIGERMFGQFGLSGVEEEDQRLDRRGLRDCRGSGARPASRPAGCFR